MVVDITTASLEQAILKVEDGLMDSIEDESLQLWLSISFYMWKHEEMNTRMGFTHEKQCALKFSMTLQPQNSYNLRNMPRPQTS